MKFRLSSKFCHRENRALVGDHTAPLTEKLRRACIAADSSNHLAGGKENALNV